MASNRQDEKEHHVIRCSDPIFPFMVRRPRNLAQGWVWVNVAIFADENEANLYAALKTKASRYCCRCGADFARGQLP